VVKATDVEIYDLSVGNVYYHPIAFQAQHGAERVTVKHCIIYDGGQQLVKSGPGEEVWSEVGSNAKHGVDDCVFEYNTLRYTTGAPNHPQGSTSPCYTNGIDAIGSSNWKIQHNLFENIRCQAHIDGPITGSIAGPSVLMWRGGENHVVNANTFIECERGVSFGLSSNLQLGGKITNNMFYRSSAQAGDVGIYCSRCKSTLIDQNTVLLSGTYSNAIEVRFSESNNVRVRNNLCDAQIAERDAPTATVKQHNTDNAAPSLFKSPSTGNLHLVSSASTAIDEANDVGAAKDFDGHKRPTTSGLVDIGADEWGEKPSIVRNLQVKDAKHTKATVSWKAPKKGSSPDCYTIQFQQKQGGTWPQKWKVSKKCHKKKSFALSDLKSSKKHRTRVRAKNTFGQGKWTKAVVFKTTG